MSNKSKRRNSRRMSSTELMNRDLLIFLWAWVSVEHPDPGRILAVRAEIMNLSESIKKGLVNLTMVAEQLRDECDLLTDWARRDRG